MKGGSPLPGVQQTVHDHQLQDFKALNLNGMQGILNILMC